MGQMDLYISIVSRGDVLEGSCLKAATNRVQLLGRNLPSSGVNGNYKGYYTLWIKPRWGEGFRETLLQLSNA